VSETGPLLSVVVTTYTRERLSDVLGLLDSLKVQTYPHLEVLFVGEREPDLCREVNDYAIRNGMGNVKVLFNDGKPGLSTARNVAIPRARGELIALVDDDVVMVPEWAEEVVRAFQDASVIGVTGPALPLWGDPAMVWLPEELYWLVSCTAWSATDRVREVRNAWGMNMTFRRVAFEQCGLFDEFCGFPCGSYEGGLGEDNEFSFRVRMRTGGRILFTPGAVVLHRVRAYRFTWSFIRKRAFGLGRSRRKILLLYRGSRGEDPLDPEHDLLLRILVRRIPQEILNLLSRPRTSLKRLAVICYVLVYALLGFYSHLSPPLGHRFLDNDGFLREAR
jgi:GT2 family glycosyltransferase